MNIGRDHQGQARWGWGLCHAKKSPSAFSLPPMLCWSPGKTSQGITEELRNTNPEWGSIVLDTVKIGTESPLQTGYSPMVTLCTILNEEQSCSLMSRPGMRF